MYHGQLRTQPQLPLSRRDRRLRQTRRLQITMQTGRDPQTKRGGDRSRDRLRVRIQPRRLGQVRVRGLHLQPQPRLLVREHRRRRRARPHALFHQAHRLKNARPQGRANSQSSFVGGSSCGTASSPLRLGAMTLRAGFVPSSVAASDSGAACGSSAAIPCGCSAGGSAPPEIGASNSPNLSRTKYSTSMSANSAITNTLTSTSTNTPTSINAHA